MVEHKKSELERIILGILSSVKNMELYPAEHPSVQGPLNKLHDALSSLLRASGNISLGIVDEVLVFGGIPFYGTNIMVREVQHRLEARGINALEIHHGLTPAETEAFSRVLTEEPAALEEEGSVSDVLRAREVLHIVVKDAKEVYTRAVDAVGEVLQEARLGRIPKAAKARAAVGDLKRMVLADRPAILALTLMKSYDSYLFNHSVNVSVLALALAQSLEIPEEDLADIGLAGLLHDIGKTLTPKNITLKPGNLTDEEWDVMRKHPEKSAEIVTSMEGVSELVTRIVREHHVHFDQRGYPSLEPGEHTHPYSRVVTVADCYDAITTLRPYQKPYHPREAMQIMERLSGKVIDPRYFEQFVKVLGIFPVGTLVRLDTNEVAVVLETFAERPLQPRIKIVFNPDGKPLAPSREIDLGKQAGYTDDIRNIVSTVDPILYNADPAALI